MRVGILECDHVDDRHRDVAGDYRDMFAALLAAVTADLEVVAYDVVEGELPPGPDACDGWLATGSRRSAFDAVDWIDGLGAFVQDLHDTGTPYVGVCFGHQVLARALGGEVRRADGGWGVGAHRMMLDRREAWMVPPRRDVDLLFMHQDQVTRLPRGAMLLGRTDHCPNAMFRVGSTMLGIQAHPEFRPTYLERLLDERVERIGPRRSAAARRSLTSSVDGDVITRWLVRFFHYGRGFLP